MTGIEVRGLCVSYGRTQVLRDVSFSAERGRITGLIGPNGAGKSTAIKAVAGTLRPDSGSITVDGRPPRRGGSPNVAHIPQRTDADLSYPIQVAELVRMGRLPHLGPWRRSRRADRAAVASAIGRAGLNGLERRHLGTLSGGQHQRVHMARALAQEASVFLLDEPFTGIDQATTFALLALLRDLADEGATVLLIEHAWDRLEPVCDRFVLIDGVVLADGSPNQIADQLARTGTPRRDPRRASEAERR